MAGPRDGVATATPTSTPRDPARLACRPVTSTAEIDAPAAKIATTTSPRTAAGKGAGGKKASVSLPTNSLARLGTRGDEALMQLGAVMQGSATRVLHEALVTLGADHHQGGTRHQLIGRLGGEGLRRGAGEVCDVIKRAEARHVGAAQTRATRPAPGLDCAFNPNARVRLAGLASSAYMNGRSGTVVGWSDPAKSKYIVVLDRAPDTGQHRVMVKDGNLEPEDSSGERRKKTKRGPQPSQTERRKRRKATRAKSTGASEAGVPRRSRAAVEVLPVEG